MNEMLAGFRYGFAHPGEVFRYEGARLFDVALAAGLAVLSVGIRLLDKVIQSGERMGRGGW